MVQQRTAKPRKKAAGKAGHKHRAPGAKKKTATKKGLLDALGKTGAKKKAKKDDKPTVTLEDQAASLLELQQAKADAAEAAGRVKELEGELIPEMEERRRALCMSKGQYIRTINIRATGDDDEGNPINAGQATYGVKKSYIGFDPRGATTDDGTIEAAGDEATLRDEAIYHIADALDCEWDDAEEHYDERIEEKTTIKLKDGALDDPDLVAILQEHCLEWLESTTKATPSEAFHERSHFNETDAAIMEALVDNGLVKPYKGSVKASGAPKAARKAVKIRKK